MTGFADVQDYVERAMRQRLAALPDGVWETQDFIDRDPSGSEGMIPIKVKLTIKPGTGRSTISPAAIRASARMYNSAFGATFSAVAAGHEDVLPGSAAQLRLLSADRDDRARRHHGQCALAGRGHRVPDAVREDHELRSTRSGRRSCRERAHRLRVQPGIPADRRARRCASPEKPIFMFYDWLPGGWGGRNGRDGCNVTTACFGTGLQSQPVEGQERGSPILTTEYQMLTDSPGPGKWRGGAGVRKTSVTARGGPDRDFLHLRPRTRDRLGHPGRPAFHAARAQPEARKGGDKVDWLGSAFSDVALNSGDVFSRPTAGGGGFGDPLERDPGAGARGCRRRLRLDRARRKDYGVVLRVIDKELCEYAVDAAATNATREAIRCQRVAGSRPIRRRSRPVIAPARSTGSTWCGVTPWCLTGTPGRCCPSRPASSGKCFISARRRHGREAPAQRCPLLLTPDCAGGTVSTIFGFDWILLQGMIGAHPIPFLQPGLVQ